MRMKTISFGAGKYGVGAVNSIDNMLSQFYESVKWLQGTALDLEF